MTLGVFTTELKKVFQVQTTMLKAGIVACSLMLVPTIQAFGIFLMCFIMNNPSTKRLYDALKRRLIVIEKSVSYVLMHISFIVTATYF